MPLEYPNGYGATALDQQQELDKRQGWAVVPTSSGLGTECEVTVNSGGDLGTGNSAVSIASGDVLADGSTVSVSSQTLDLDTGDSNPRKDVVYVDSNGDAQKKKGSPASVPADAPGDRFQTWKPAPYDMHDVDGVVLATVWIPANATTIGSGDIRDRRVPADGYFSSVDTDEATINSTGSITEVGSVDFGSVSSNSTSVVTVSLQGSYSTPPAVAIGFGNTEGANLGASPPSNAVADSITTTDFRALARNGSGSPQQIDKCGYVVMRI